ncbi:tRNA N(3)-methylcytidine methyltransferase METTL6-like [Stegodyphus dumicola]|uniref:tRNA N(3)-methylcytidine methyltransferase METTL6-like n=1 Tax=Stegodyphus dumicola TaxID=202533 RepID=UPI0015ACC3A1|nr:tRNA N(3)-methylcytidine methyltransferase METTL6-like [Stegodyphus dumicola]
MAFGNINFGHYARWLTDQEIEKLTKEKVSVCDFKQNKLEADSKKNWDLFYKRNKTNFFKDRHWTVREFEELANTTVVNIAKEGETKPVLLEVGCGVGNFIFPLIADKTKFFIHACDFSPRAIELLKENALYNSDICHAFVIDVTKEELNNVISPDSVNIATMIFVLSAIHPSKMSFTLKNIFKVLQPGGLLLIRDYGLYDQAMLRFGPGHKLSENFYVRQDGTRAFYFSEEHLENLAIEAGFEVLVNNYISRETTNYKENIRVPRIYIQAKFLKPSVVK